MTNQQIEKLIAKLPDLFFGRVGKGGFYLFGSTELIQTDRTKDLDEGQFIDKEFNPISHWRVADFLGISLKQWFDIHARYL